MKSKGNGKKKSKWNHWVIICKKGKPVAWLNGKVFNGTFETWLRQQEHNEIKGGGK